MWLDKGDMDKIEKLKAGMKNIFRNNIKTGKLKPLEKHRHRRK
jgi:hypothetical protein